MLGSLMTPIDPRPRLVKQANEEIEIVGRLCSVLQEYLSIPARNRIEQYSGPEDPYYSNKPTPEMLVNASDERDRLAALIATMEGRVKDVPEAMRDVAGPALEMIIDGYRQQLSDAERWVSSLQKEMEST